MEFIKHQNESLNNLNMNNLNINELNLNQSRYEELTNSKLEIFFNKAKNLGSGKYNFEIDIDLLNNNSDQDQTPNSELQRKTLSILNFQINEFNQIFTHNENDNNFPTIHFSVPSHYDQKQIDKFNSGCSLTHLTFRILKHNNTLQVSKTIDFLDIFLTNIESIIDSTKNNVFTSKCPIKFDSNLLVELDLKFEVGDITCLAILNRILNLFSILLNHARDCENTISFFLENYFQDSISAVVRSILEKKQEMKSCSACGNCLVF